MTQTILVTGAGGLLGRAVCDHLQQVGHRIIATDLVASSSESREVLLADLTDIHRLHAITAAGPLDGVVHCGAFSGPMVGIDNPYRLVSVNVMGTVNLLELARIRKCRRIVCCSSTSAYGPTPRAPVAPEPVPEDVALAPSSVYGATKAALEPLVAGYARQYGVDGVALRLSIYGPGRTTDCVIRTMLTDALHGRITRLAWGQDFHRQFLHVDDAARALVLALQTPPLPRRVYTITGERYLTLGELAGIVRNLLPGADIALEPGPDPLDDDQAQFDTAAARRDLGFIPAISLEDGISGYVEWLDARRDGAFA